MTTSSIAGKGVNAISISYLQRSPNFAAVGLFDFSSFASPQPTNQPILYIPSGLLAQILEGRGRTESINIIKTILHTLCGIYTDNSDNH